LIGDDDVSDIFAVDGDIESCAVRRAVCRYALILFEDAEIDHQRAVLPTATLRLIDDAGDAFAGGGAEFFRGEKDSFIFCGGFDDCRCQRMFAGALEAGGEAKKLGIVAQSLGVATRRGLPSVSVPVLSTTRVSTFSRISRASAFLMSTPARAPRPTPTMMAIGVARPKAQGQAMMRTATAFTRACAKRGCGPRKSHAMKVITAAATTGGHEPFRYAVGEALDGSAAALGLADELHDAGQQRFAADAFGAHDEGAGAVDGGADDFAVGRFFDRHGFAGDHGLVDRSCWPSSTTPSTGTFSPGRTRRRSPGFDLLERNHLSRRPSGLSRRAVRGLRSSRARMAALVRLRARSSMTWPSRTRVVMAAAASK
jgi:hypothetical protein